MPGTDGAVASVAAAAIAAEPDSAICGHVPADDAEPGSGGCEDCLRIGGEWFHLRLCLTCGHVGCCDRSPSQHASAHYHSTGHPVIRSFEPGESWTWCYADEIAVGL